MAIDAMKDTELIGHHPQYPGAAQRIKCVFKEAEVLHNTERHKLSDKRKMKALKFAVVPHSATPPAPKPSEPV